MDLRKTYSGDFTCANSGSVRYGDTNTNEQATYTHCNLTINTFFNVSKEEKIGRSTSSRSTPAPKDTSEPLRDSLGRPGLRMLRREMSAISVDLDEHLKRRRIYDSNTDEENEDDQESDDEDNEEDDNQDDEDDEDERSIDDGNSILSNSEDDLHYYQRSPVSKTRTVAYLILRITFGAILSSLAKEHVRGRNQVRR
ncbi:hypothetical protein BS50DRAFT_639497 [Corynespora cassiicola Philippines]|uniref:Uncharacterized protein n=1 Tax=Corynespora cassiicola Philippines TaxID=1448308 RepID=A0A2T2N744_CORCC|nr:hypothetical protein BS50DRAFT_639497 [Corynespora cassiicola Philippines]